MLDEHLNARLSDFGWSCFYSRVNKRKSFAGTPEYMAPEIIRRKKQSFSVDIWALGILLYEMLHEKVPFVEHDDCLNFKTKDIEFDSSLSPSVIDFILLCLNRDAKKRPTVAKLLQHELFYAFSSKTEKVLRLQDYKENTNYLGHK